MSTSQEIQSVLAECALRVVTDNREGAGFFVAPGLAVTCAHVIEDGESGDYPLTRVGVIWKGDRYPARVVRYAGSPYPDIAVLEVEIEDHPCVYLFESVRSDDSLFVCGYAGQSGADPVSHLLAGVEPINGSLKLQSGPTAPSLSGSPILNLRTGAVCAILNTNAALTANSDPRAIPVLHLEELFPDVYEAHDRHHHEGSRWFDCKGVVGTVFAAHSHLQAMTTEAEQPIQPILAPMSGMGAMDLLAPAMFRPLSARSDLRMESRVNTGQILENIQTSHRSLLIVGQAGSGRSSLLRWFGYRAADSCRSFGSRSRDCLFPILLRANHLVALEGPVEDVILSAISHSGGRAVAPTLLPSGFLTDLAELPRLRLLIMLDGVDEIQNARELADLVGIIGRIQGDPGFGAKTQLILTSRPSSAEHFRYSDLDIYEIMPLGAESIETTVQRWLGPESESFLDSNSHLLETGLLSMPLVLSVALALFERRREELPSGVVSLYGELVSECFQSWKQADLAAAYGSDVLDNAVEILGRVALELLRSSTSLDSERLRETAERFFLERDGFEGSLSRSAAERFTAFVGSDSLFLNKAGERYYWSHRSFRDYFAASCLVGSQTEVGTPIKEIKDRWFDANWGRTPSFSIQMLQNPDERDKLVNEILSSDRILRLEFVTSLLREGAVLVDGTRDRLVDQLLLSSHEEHSSYGVDPAPPTGGAFSFDLLLSLAHLPTVRTALEEIAAGSSGNAVMQETASERLALVAS